MSSALVKSKLKAARDAISAKDWSKAEQSASDAISFESSNYNARVFLAVAKLNLEKYQESEEAYRTAIDAQPKTLLAWQGLASFYEKTDRWDKYLETQRKLADLALEAEDPTKCAEALQKILKTQRDHGSSKDALDALRLFLPDSSYYPVLSQLPPPDLTAPTATTTYEAQCLVQDPLPILQETIRTQEHDEDLAINREVDKRRQRLTTTTSAEETRKAVLRETMSKSELPALYQKVLDSHTAAQDVRRETEDKLLRYLHTLLIALPNPFPALANAAVSEAAREQEETRAKVARKEKNAIRGRVEELARGMTTLKLPNELAWSILLEWRDMEEAGDWDIYSLKRYMDLYPESGMSKLAQIVLHLPDPSLEKDAEAPKLSTDQAIEQVDTAFAQIQAASVRAHLLASSFYLQQKDYELVIDTAEAGLASINRLEADIGRQLTGLRTLLETDLAVSLTHHDSPRHHVRALRLADTVLQRKPAELRAILAKAYIFESSERWQEAYELFQRVESEDTEPRVQFEARREKAWCLGNVTDRAKDALDELYEVATLMDQDAEIERVQKAQAWWRCGQCSWKMDTEEHTAAAFDAYITGIKRDNTYAPAFTALGFYYLEAVDPPNHKTATKCFQKAFELDEKEDVAARYLADEFAENGDWDLVEIVARRVVSGDHRTAGKAQTATEAPSSGTFAARKHAWAWKAIGAAELKSKKFPQAITALQYAIRGVPGDVSCWLQLAIAYRGSGKHVAALKTLGRVVELDSGNWHAHYLVGDIQRQLGLFDAAIRSFEQLQDERPDELAIRVARAETQLLFALSQIRNGFTSRGASELVYSLELAVEILQDPNAARIAWKLIADALAKLGSLPEGDKDTIQPILSELLSRLAKENIDAKNPLLTVVTTEFVKEKVASMTIQQQCMCMSVLACSMRVLLHGDTDEGAGSTWYDLGHALHQLHPQYAALETQHKPEHVVMQSIQCLRNALQREPLNGQFWNLLGVIATESTPKLAQHSLIRACELNVRSAIPWSNLGLFYLKHEDYELANKAFLRAQVLEPDYAQAWLGQAALARLHGDTAQATVLTEHAAGLSNGSVPDADLASATNAFDASRKLTSKDLFIRPRFLTTRYLQQKPATSAAASHLDGLLCERLERKEEAVTSLEQAVQLLEAEYELNESEEVERRYIIANASLGRARLAVGQYEASITALDAALALLSDDSNGQDDQGTELRAQCLLVKGLDAYFLEDLEGSLKCFEDALAALDGRTDSTGRLQALKNQCTLLLAGVLYGLGGDEQRAEAERQLLENISDASTGAPNVSVITALSALAIVGDNGGLLDAALAEILKLPVDQQIEQDPRGDIAYLSAAHRRLQDDDDGVRKTFAHALHALPTSSHAQASFLQAQQQVRSVDDTVDDSTDAQIHATPFELQAWAAKSASLSAASLKR